MGPVGFWQQALWDERLLLSWMGVNLALAIAPGIGAFILHRWWRWLPGVRWALLAATGALLPNAPYLFTDLVHLRWSLIQAPSRLVAETVVLPMYGLLIATGLLVYAYVMHVLRRQMVALRWSLRRRVTVEVAVDAATAIGVALGRISRLNSWNILAPDRLEHGLRILTRDPRSVILAGVIVVFADVIVERLAAGAFHRLHRLIIG